ncbi:unnamed protein product, partial [Candidula unifasciata]
PVINSTSLATPGTFSYVPLAQPLTTTFAPTVVSLPQPPTYYPPIIYWYQAPPVSPPPAISYYTTATNMAADLYAGPFLVVMRGLPMDVTVQDIVTYFQDFPE